MIFVISVFLPAIIGILVVLPKTRNTAIRFLFPIAAVPAVIAVLPGISADIEISSLILGMRFGLGTYGQIFLLAAALVWFASALFTLAYMRKKPRIPSFVFFYLLTMSGNFGLILARDIPSFYTFFAIMTYAAYGLITHDRTPDALRAGNVYLVMSLIGETAVVAAIFLTVSSASGIGIEDIAPALENSPWRGVIFVAAFIGFGIKAGAFLLHFWLPIAHPAAPTPASAVLSGCMIKAGLLGWLYFFPAGAVDFPVWGVIFATFGLAALFYGIVIGLLKHNPKTILAYSSISQMGLMTLTLGVGLKDAALWPLLLPILLVLVLNHALAKGILFLVTGTAPSVAIKGWSGRLVLVGAFFPVLALAGFPWTGGAAAKYGLKHASASGSLPWLIDPALILGLSALVTALLLTHFLIRLGESMNRQETQASLPFPFGLCFPWVILIPALAGVMIIVSSSNMAIETQLAEMMQYDVWSSVGPVLTGLLAGILFRLFCGQCTLPDTDLWEKMMKIPRFLLKFDLWIMFIWEKCKQWFAHFFWIQYFKLFGKEEKSAHVFKWIEHRIMHWHTAGLMFVVLLTGFLLLNIFAGQL